MPTILEQPKWAFWKFQEVYQCDVKGDLTWIKESVAVFFQRSPVKDFTLLADGFHFRRNTGWRMWISHSERDLKQEVAVTLHNHQSLVRVIISYHVFFPSLFYRVGQSQLLKEVIDLEMWLCRQSGNDFKIEPKTIGELKTCNPVHW